MIIDGREIVFTEHLFEQLANIQSYSSFYSVKNARKLSTEIIDFVTDVIAPSPYIFIEYEGVKTLDKIYRRAVFKRKYSIIYKVLTNQIDILTIYHTS